MVVTVSLLNLLLLFVAMVALAALPSISVLTVASRAAAGFWHGAMTALGVVTGDIIFVLLAIFGLTAMNALLGDFSWLIKGLAVAYLLYLSFLLGKAAALPPPAQQHSDRLPQSFFADFMAGLTLTLADQKAIAFYLGFLPAFVDLRYLSTVDIGLIILIIALAVGGTKLLYAGMVSRLALQHPGLVSRLHQLAAMLMLLVACGLLWSLLT